jgi:hypothetical protein
MSTVFDQGQTLGQGDLDVFLEDDVGNPTNAYEISYAVYFVDTQTASEVLIGSPSRTPVNPSVGEYYASLLIPTNAEPGCYRIRWTFRETASSSEEGAVQEFAVVAESSLDPESVYSDCISGLINKMRMMTRDNNPDRNYRFRPPEGEGAVGCYNQVFGYIWTDEEFAEFLEIALWKWNLHPPNTESMYTSVDRICSQRPSWQAALLWGALVNAAQALAYNWVADEFSVAPNTLVRVYLPGGEEVELPIEELYEICKEGV